MPLSKRSIIFTLLAIEKQRRLLFDIFKKLRKRIEIKTVTGVCETRVLYTMPVCGP